MGFFEILFRHYSWDPIKFCRTMWNIFRVKGVDIASLDSERPAFDIEQDPTFSVMTTTGGSSSLTIENLQQIRDEVTRSFGIPRDIFNPPMDFNREVLSTLGRNTMSIHSTEKFDSLTKDATIKDILSGAVKLEKDKAKERVDFHLNRFLAKGNEEEYVKSAERPFDTMIFSSLEEHERDRMHPGGFTTSRDSAGIIGPDLIHYRNVAEMEAAQRRNAEMARRTRVPEPPTSNSG